ncbi:MAG TPA: ATP-binding protein [Patescibacteria group bacterium]|nr:ATP-binding protein [Patescibacteria group bacterium]
MFWTNLAVTLLALVLAVLLRDWRNRCRRPVIYIVQGFLAAGKTTYSKQLAAKTGALRLNADEYCAGNFTQGQLDADWESCFAAAVAALWQVAEAQVKSGNSVILDFGFWDRASRDHARARAAEWKAKASLVYLDVPADVLLERLKTRTSAVAERNRANFHEIKKHFQPPQPDEHAVVIREDVGVR